MSEIKAGDLVMIVRPTLCCGGIKHVGGVFVAAAVSVGMQMCSACGHVYSGLSALDAGDGLWADIHRLKKIDPPPIGDSLPTRADLPIKESA